MFPNERMHATAMQPQERVCIGPVMSLQATVPLLEKSDRNASSPQFLQRMPSLPWSSTFALAAGRLPMHDGMQRIDF